MQAAGGYVVTVSFGKIIDHRDVVPLLQQKVDGVRADVPGAACNQDSSWLHKI